MAFRRSLFLALALNKLVLAQDGREADPSQSIVLAHGVVMTALFAIFFPIGAIIVKVLKAPNAGRIHGVWQGISYVGSSAGFGIGVYLATMEENPWVTHQGHAIIGTIVTGLLLLQPIAGYIHHRSYSKYGKRTALGLAHRLNGRILLVLGVINGGLGLWLADEDKNFIILYSVVAAVVYVAWAAIGIWKGKKGSGRKSSAASSI